MSVGYDYALITTSGMLDLAKRVVKKLQKTYGRRFELIKLDLTEFADGESKIQIPQTVREMRVFVLFPMRDPDVNTALVRLMMTLDALTRASVARITLITPYMSFLRQDRKDRPRTPITAKMVANMIESYRKVDYLVMFDMHTEQIQGFYNIPVDNLYGHSVLAPYLRTIYPDLSRVVIVSPDDGGEVRVRRCSEAFDPSLQTTGLDKHRVGTNEIEMQPCYDNLEGLDAVLLDDILDTGKTIAEAAAKVLAAKARSVRIICTHGILSRHKKDRRTAEDRLKALGIPVTITESIPRSKQYAKKHPWITIIRLCDTIAATIDRAVTPGGSINQMMISKN